MWERGNVGMGSYLLLRADPKRNESLDTFVATVGSDDLAWVATLVRLDFAEDDGIEALNNLVKLRPQLAGHPFIPELAETVRRVWLVRSVLATN